MGWKWTFEDPTPIHLNHKEIWEHNYVPHFHRLCYGVLLPLHQLMFDRMSPRFTKEAISDLQMIGRYFIEEPFSYIKSFGSSTPPHVLPLYVSDKLMAREVAYITVGNVLTKALKDSKNYLWPSFPISCGSFTLSNFNHALKER